MVTLDIQAQVADLATLVTRAFLDSVVTQVSLAIQVSRASVVTQGHLLAMLEQLPSQQQLAEPLGIPLWSLAPVAPATH